jgi:hypothetical protein
LAALVLVLLHEWSLDLRTATAVVVVVVLIA